jgi:hypothetical protein
LKRSFSDFLTWPESKCFGTRRFRRGAGCVSGTLKSRMESGFASAFTVGFAWAEFVCRDRQGTLQSLRSPMVIVWKWWSDTNGLKIKISKIKMKMVNVKMAILNVVAKWGESVTGASASILLSTCFSFPTLNSLRVFSMAFTSSAFAVTFVFAVLNRVFSFSLFFLFLSLFSLLMSSSDFILL